MKIPTWYHRWEIMQRLPLILKELLEMEQQGLQLEVRTKPLQMQAELRHSNFEVMLLNPQPYHQKTILQQYSTCHFYLGQIGKPCAEKKPAKILSIGGIVVPNITTKQ